MVMRVLAGLLMWGVVMAPVAAEAFSADTLAGSWTGTWKNKRFKGVGGPFTVVIAAPDADTISIDASGANFGCGSATQPVILRRGAGWTDTSGTVSFTVGGSTITLSYAEAGGKLTGSGANCHGPWTFKGKVKKGSRFKGRSVTDVGNGKAPSTVKATRQ